MKARDERRRTRRSIAASLVAALTAAVAVGSAPAGVAAAGQPPATAGQPAAASTRPPAASAQATYDEAMARLQTRHTDDLVASLRLFGEAARSDPSNARAHVGVATAASLLALYSVAPPRPLLATARAAAAEALRLEPELATAHAVMGLVEYLDGWDFAAAESRFHQALELDRTAATTWHWYGMLLMATSRFDDALAAYDSALRFARAELLLVKRTSVLAVAGRREAERELRQLIRRFPESSLAKRDLGYLLIGDGRGDEGLEALRGAAELSGGLEDNADLGWGYARTGHRKEAEAIAARLTKAARAAVRQARAAGAAAAGPSPEKRSSAAAEFVSPIDPALVYAGLDRPDDAFEWLETAREIHDPGLVYLATSPGFEPLRDDPRFATLLSAIGLDAAVAAAAREEAAARAKAEAERRNRDGEARSKERRDRERSYEERGRRERDGTAEDGTAEDGQADDGEADDAKTDDAKTDDGGRAEAP